VAYLCEVTLPQDTLGVSASTANVVGFEIRPSPSHSLSEGQGDEEDDVINRSVSLSLSLFHCL
jgi:hypothetical protein